MSLNDPHAADILRGYLDRVGFGEIYKFIVGPNNYALMPSVIGKTSADQIGAFFDEVLAHDPRTQLLRPLMGDEAVWRDDLDAGQIQVADAMIAAGILMEDDGQIGPTKYQMISAYGRDLLIDRRINFGGAVHEVYIGYDSYAMINYIQPSAMPRGARALDLCTGSGIAALYMALSCDDVVATDIGSVPLSIVRFNRRLNHCEDVLTIREERLEETLRSGERFDILTCNPPFVAYPPQLKATLYSQGTELDGQGYLRDIIQALPEVLVPGGSAYLVADLVGNADGPHFIRELEYYARALGLGIDVYIDNRIESEVQVAPMSHYLHRLNPEYSVEDMADVFRRFQRDDLKASHYHMSTMRLVNGAAEPQVRVLRRFAQRRKTGVDGKWRHILERA